MTTAAIDTITAKRTRAFFASRADATRHARTLGWSTPVRATHPERTTLVWSTQPHKVSRLGDPCPYRHWITGTIPLVDPDFDALTY